MGRFDETAIKHSDSKCRTNLFPRIQRVLILSNCLLIRNISQHSIKTTSGGFLNMS